MKALVFWSSVNTEGKADATGAFIPEAAHFANLHKIPKNMRTPVACVRMTPDERRKTVLDVLRSFVGENLDGIAIFCHGWADGLQIGFNRGLLSTFARAVKDACRPEPFLALYACSTAENDVKDNAYASPGPGTDGGFADLLRDQLARIGVSGGWVDAHKSAGHCSRNPFVVRFRMGDVEDRALGGVGGDWIVCPGSSSWKKWKLALADDERDLRLRFPIMTSVQIKTELA